MVAEDVRRGVRYEDRQKIAAINDIGNYVCVKYLSV
jgi:hypothetical protein